MIVAATPPLLALTQRLEARIPLDDREREMLLDLPAATVHIRANRPIAGDGAKAGHACLVIEGLVGRSQHSRGGGRQITAVYLPGEIACLEGMIRAERSSAIEALAATTLLVIPHDALRRIEQRQPGIGQALWSEILFHAAIGGEWLFNIGRRRSLARTAHLLCELACRHGGPGRVPRTRFPLAARQGHLADMLALTPVHLNRTLKVLREERLASFQDRDLCIHDWPRLARLADFDPAYLD
jgi:CRP-like cAMP-binding protein